MEKGCKIRNQGAIPERRHDAFLLALLLAVVLNITAFAVQAIVPRLSSLVQYLAPEPAQQEEPEALPFVLVDPSIFDEEVDDAPADAESLVAREARQRESMPNLPGDKPYVEEGMEELSTMLEGLPGPAESATVDAPESAPSEAGDQEPSDTPEGETPEPEEAPAEPVPEPIPEEPAPEPIPPQEPPPEPVPGPEPPPEPIPEQLPLPIPEPVFEPVAEPAPEPPEPELQPEPTETIDLAALPVAPDGFLDSQRQFLEDLARREDAARQRRELEERQREEYLEEQRRQEYERRQMEAMRQQELERRQREEYGRQLREQAQQRQRPETPQPRRREERPRPKFRRIGPGSEASEPSRRGGAPRRRNTGSSVNLLDSDPNMKYLAHKYAAYMKKVAEQLQQSLNREVILQPTGYTTGQAKIRFTIAPDGSLGYAGTEYPEDVNYVRITSENTLRNAAPFDPPTREMLEDPVFRQMSLTVSLY